MKGIIMLRDSQFSSLISADCVTLAMNLSCKNEPKLCTQRVTQSWPPHKKSKVYGFGSGVFILLCNWCSYWCCVWPVTISFCHLLSASKAVELGMKREKVALWNNHEDRTSSLFPAEAYLNRMGSMQQSTDNHTLKDREEGARTGMHTSMCASSHKQTDKCKCRHTHTQSSPV